MKNPEEEGDMSRITMMSAVILAAGLMAGCATIPKAELADARMAILASEKVNAAKYAPDELSSAKQLYSTATNQVTLKKNKDAKQTALASKSRGDQAYFKALDEFIKDQNDTTAKSMEEAKESHADAAVPDEFNQAKDLYDQAQKEMNELKILSVQLQQAILLQDQQQSK